MKLKFKLVRAEITKHRMQPTPVVPALHITEHFAEQYARRAGVEGTISQGVRAFDLRQARYLGVAKTHLQPLLTATVMNITRALHWLAGDRPTQTRSSAFAKLHAVAA